MKDCAMRVGRGGGRLTARTGEGGERFAWIETRLLGKPRPDKQTDRLQTLKALSGRCESSAVFPEWFDEVEELHKKGNGDNNARA